MVIGGSLTHTPCCLERGCAQVVKVQAQRKKGGAHLIVNLVTVSLKINIQSDFRGRKLVLYVLSKNEIVFVLFCFV